jgi:hypothetical protein
MKHKEEILIRVDNVLNLVKGYKRKYNNLISLDSNQSKWDDNKINYDKKECYSKELNEYINLLDWQLTFIYNLKELVNVINKKKIKEE